MKKNEKKNEKKKEEEEELGYDRISKDCFPHQRLPGNLPYNPSE